MDLVKGIYYDPNSDTFCEVLDAEEVFINGVEVYLLEQGKKYRVIEYQKKWVFDGCYGRICPQMVLTKGEELRTATIRINKKQEIEIADIINGWVNTKKCALSTLLYKEVKLPPPKKKYNFFKKIFAGIN